jgi:hypothetical protein
VLFNGNPLLRYDGYYMLADFVEVPNLRQQATALIKQAAGRFFLGTDLENERVLPNRHRLALMSYAGVEHEYVELPGISHGPAIAASQQYVFEFFGKHTRLQ